MERKKEKKEKYERKRRKKEREKERKKEKEKEKGSYETSSSYFWCFDGRSSLGRGLKFVYSMRATLQEVGILPHLVYGYRVLTLHSALSLGLVLDWETEGF